MGVDAREPMKGEALGIDGKETRAKVASSTNQRAVQTWTYVHSRRERESERGEEESMGKRVISKDGNLPHGGRGKVPSRGPRGPPKINCV